MNQTRANLMSKIIEYIELNKYGSMYLDESTKTKNLQLVKEMKELLGKSSSPKDDMEYCLLEVEYFLPWVMNSKKFFMSLVPSSEN